MIEQLDDDRPDAAKRLEEARLRRGFKTARSATEFFGWNYHSYAQHESGLRGLSRVAKRYAAAYKVTEGWLLTGDGSAEVSMVPLRGKVGAGSEVFVFDDDQPMDYVEAPPEISENTAALEIDGDSMFPVYEDKTLIYYSKMVAPAEMVNRRCVVKLTNGKLLVKKLRPGTSPQVWNLESFNPSFPTLEDQTLEWVAKIDWVRER